LERWLKYYDARVKSSLGQQKDAESVFRALASEDHDDHKLRLWVLGDLGTCLWRAWRLREALSTYQETLELAKRTSADTWNIAHWQSCIAMICSTLDEGFKAEAHCKEAIDSAKDMNDFSRIATSLAGLSGLQQKNGRFADAVDSACKAL